MSSTNIKTISIICNPSNKTGNNSYKISLGNLGFDSFVRCSLKSCSFQNIQYNVIAEGQRVNNTFYFMLGGGLEEIVVPAGFYNITNLLDYLRTEMAIIFAASGIIPLPTLTDLSYDSITGKVSITVDGGGVATQFDLTQALGRGSINELLGNSTYVIIDTLTPTAYEFADIINLQGDSRVHLVSSAIAQNSGITNLAVNPAKVNGRNLSLVRSIMVNEGFGNYVEYDSNDIDAEELVYTLPQNFSILDIALQDPYGNILDLGNSELTLELLTWKTV